MIVLVHRQAGQAVTLTEDQPARAPWADETQDVIAKADGASEALLEKGAVQRLARVPTIESNTDLALAVVQAAGDEISVMGVEINFSAVRGLAFNGRDSTGVHPWVAAIKRF